MRLKDYFGLHALSLGNINNAKAKPMKLTPCFREDNVVYSFGKHHPLFFRMGNINILNLSKYSTTTARHRTWARRAMLDNGIEFKWLEIPNLPKGDVRDLRTTDVLCIADSNMSRYVKQLKAMKSKHSKKYKFFSQMLDDSIYIHLYLNNNNN